MLCQGERENCHESHEKDEASHKIAFQLADHAAERLVIPGPLQAFAQVLGAAELRIGKKHAGFEVVEGRLFPRDLDRKQFLLHAAVKNLRANGHALAHDAVFRSFAHFIFDDKKLPRLHHLCLFADADQKIPFFAVERVRAKRQRRFAGRAAHLFFTLRPQKV